VLAEQRGIALRKLLVNPPRRFGRGILCGGALRALAPAEIIVTLGIRH
jgi:hypothetical protein